MENTDIVWTAPVGNEAEQGCLHHLGSITRNQDWWSNESQLSRVNRRKTTNQRRKKLLRLSHLAYSDHWFKNCNPEWKNNFLNLHNQLGYDACCSSDTPPSFLHLHHALLLNIIVLGETEQSAYCFEFTISYWHFIHIKNVQ